MTTLPCPDPEGCKHFKNEIKLEERIKELEAEIKRLMLWIDYYGFKRKVEKGGKP